MQRDDEDDAWRAIVENYGDRPQIDDGAPPAVEPPAPPTYDDVPAEEEPADLARADEERFVPPPPPPLPRPRGLRAAGWFGVFVAPALLLVFTVLGVDLPDLLVQALVAWFVAGFLYLVWTMPRGPRDPWDDGAKL